MNYKLNSSNCQEKQWIQKQIQIKKPIEIGIFICKIKGISGGNKGYGG